jgi:IMP dehydrogenase/GMP reductase
MENKFDFNDILIKPSVTSTIDSRKTINPFYDGFLPLITAPMDTVIDANNERQFRNLKINTCMPRGEASIDSFNSFSIDEISLKYYEGTLELNGKYLIDIANGHMEKLLKITKSIKKDYPNLTLMVGNVANPQTYALLSDAGADFIRVGIGNGNACSTTVHTGVGYPMASLIKECYNISCTLDNPAKIVADGGMKSYSDIIKALALGADYVMVGSLFNKAIESCGDNYLWGKIKIGKDRAESLYKMGFPIYKKFRGMSTKEVQKKWGKEVLTTSEGVVRFRKVEYTLKKWVDNFEDYLRSAMSYSDARTLEDFIGQVEIINITDNAYNRFKK